jgi:hypothetical protein
LLCVLGGLVFSTVNSASAWRGIGRAAAVRDDADGAGDATDGPLSPGPVCLERSNSLPRSVRARELGTLWNHARW